MSLLELSFINDLPPMCKASPNTLCVLLLIPSSTLCVGSYCPHFTDGEMETRCIFLVTAIWFDLPHWKNTQFTAEGYVLEAYVLG